MKTQDLRKKLHERLRHPAALLTILAMVMISGLAATGWANALYILTGADDAAIVLDGSQEIPDLSEQMMYVASGSRGYDITLEAGLSVTVQRDDATLTTQSRKEESISALLDRLGVTPTPLEMVAVDLTAPGSLEVTVAEDIVYYDEVSEAAPFNTVRVANPDMLLGSERVTQEGVDGVRTSIYEVVWSGGELVSRQYVEEVDSTAVDQIVEYGTSTDEVARDDQLLEVIKNEDGTGTLVFASGSTLDFAEAKSMTATAYTAGENGVGFITATGTDVHVGVAAVDRKVIPLGTRMFVVTSDGIVYGMAVAEDTGVRGNIIDLYHNTYRECIEFGRRSCTVYILE